MKAIFMVLLLAEAVRGQALHPEARFFFNTTGAYNATTLATVTGAMLFVALNTAFVMLFVTPPSITSSKSGKESEDEYEDEEYYSEYYDDQVRKKKKKR